MTDTFKQWLKRNEKRVDMAGDAWQIYELADQYAAEQREAGRFAENMRVREYTDEVIQDAFIDPAILGDYVDWQCLEKSIERLREAMAIGNEEQSND